MNKFTLSRSKDGFMNLFMEEKTMTNRHSQSILQMIHEIKMINLQKRQHSDVFRVLNDERHTPELGKFTVVETERVKKNQFLPTRDTVQVKPVKPRRPRPIEIVEEEDEQPTYYLQTPMKWENQSKPSTRNAKSNQQIPKVLGASILMPTQKKELERVPKTEGRLKESARSRSETKIKLPALNTMKTLGISSQHASSRRLEAEINGRPRENYMVRRPYLAPNPAPKHKPMPSPPPEVKEVVESKDSIDDISGWNTHHPEESPLHGIY